MPSSEGYVTTEDGVRLFFQTVGSGAQTVLIPNASFLFTDFQDLGGERTLVFYDMRNRGRSDEVSDGSRLERGIHHDVEDLEAIRRHFGVSEVNVIGHSALGLMAILYAMRYQDHAGRIVQIGSMPPNPRKQYLAHLTNADATLTEVSTKLGQLMKASESEDAQEFGRKWRALMRVLFVANPADAGKVSGWAGDVPKDRIVSGMKHWGENILPSIQSLNLAAEEVAKVRTPVLAIHGRRDRQSPYGGAREWAAMLPDARLVTVDDAAHVPWIEGPEKVFGSIRTFLDGAWPEGAEKVESVA